MNTIHSTKEIKATARHLLIGKYGVAVAICFLFNIIPFGVRVFGSGFSALTPALGVVWDIVFIIVQGALQGGVLNFALNVVAGRDINVSDVFYFVNPNAGIRKLTTFLLVNIMTGFLIGLPAMPSAIALSVYYLGNNPIALYVAGGMMIPGAVLSLYVFLSLEMSSVIVVESYYSDGAYYTPLGRRLSAISVMKESADMMDGQRMRLLKLYLSFLGWVLLDAISFGLVFLWYGAYRDVSVGLFYNDLLMGRIGNKAGSAFAEAQSGEQDRVVDETTFNE